jgi:uncharacterized membrane protein YhdT
MLLEKEDDTPTIKNTKILKRRIYGLVYHHIWWLMFGLLGAAMVGAAFPIWGKISCLYAQLNPLYVSLICIYI